MRSCETKDELLTLLISTVLLSKPSFHANSNQVKNSLHRKGHASTYAWPGPIVHRSVIGCSITSRMLILLVWPRKTTMQI